MSVWLCLPSARPAAEANIRLARWREQGYKIFLWRDTLSEPPIFDKLAVGAYPGYYQAVNRLAKIVLAEEPDCDWIVTCGDDTFPDLTKSADAIAAECSAYFLSNSMERGLEWCESIWPGGMKLDQVTERLGSFGIMQPTGDRWGENDLHSRAMWPNAPAYIDRICGSPWLGREWCLRGNQGAGPFHPGFWHMFGDEALQETAKKLGILWQRRDLTQVHDHWGLTGNALRMPDFLKRANSPDHWAEAKAMLERLRAEDFAECMPLETRRNETAA